MTQRVTKPIALDRSFNTTGSTPQNIADVLAGKLDAIKEAIAASGGDVDAAFVCYYNITTATQIYNAIESGKVPYFYNSGVVAQLRKVETNKYTFRTTSTREVDGATYLNIVDYIVNGSVWSTETKTISGGGSGGQQAYLKKVSSSAGFDTTGLDGMQTILSVDDVPSDGVYQVSVMLSVAPKTARPTKSDLVFGFYGAAETGMLNRIFHAVVDDSQTFAQQLSFSTSVSLKAGQNTLKISCDSLNTQYLVFVDELTVAQLVNGVYHNGDDFDEVHTLPEAPDFNNDDGVLVDGDTGGPRFMLWQTLANKVLGFIKSLSTAITAFRTGDYIAVDGPSGTAKMSKDDLLAITTQNAVDSGVAASSENVAALEKVCGYQSISSAEDYASDEIFKADGTSASFEAWVSTDYVDCSNYSSLDVRGCDSHSLAQDIPVITFFDASKNFISGVPVGGGITNVRNIAVTIPASAKYYRAVYQNLAISNPYVNGWLSAGSSFAKKYVESEVSSLQTDVTNIKSVVGANDKLCDVSDYTSNNIYNINGGYASYEAWKSTDFIDVKNYQTVKVRGVEYKSVGLILPVITFFDSSKNFIIGYHTSGNNNHIINDKEYNVPAGAKYFRCIYCTNDINNPYAYGLISGLIEISDEIQPLIDISSLKIACVGDSLTAGDYGSEPEGTMNIGADTYPTYLHRQLGSETLNYGVCGFTASMYWSSKVQTISWSTIKPDVVIIMLGTNGGLTDTLDTDVEPYNDYNDYANTNTGCYCKIIEYISEQLSGKGIIVLCKAPYVDGSRRPAYAGRVNRANAVIPKIAAKYNLPVIDTWELCLSKLNTNVLQPVDGLHFGKYGYSRLGTFIGSKLKSVLSFDLG